MSLPIPFEKGVLGVLNAEWRLKLETPLIIRNESKAAIKLQSEDQTKGRGTELEIVWLNSEEKLSSNTKGKKLYSELADFNYNFEVNGNRLRVEYSIPASSIRGSLRNSAIRRWIAPDYRNIFTLRKKDEIPKEEIEKQIMQAVKLLEDKKNAWFDILSLFGNAFDIDSKHDHPLTWAGRLKINVSLDNDTPDKEITYCGKKVERTDAHAPQNISLNIANRGPIDPVTMGARSGGLHFWLEMSEGQFFRIKFHILNPKLNDLELLDLWTDEINEGFLCFGASGGENNGRASIVEENYELFVSRASMLSTKIEDLGHPKPSRSDLLLDDIWVGAKLPRNDLKTVGLENLLILKGDN